MDRGRFLLSMPSPHFATAANTDGLTNLSSSKLPSSAIIVRWLKLKSDGNRLSRGHHDHGARGQPHVPFKEQKRHWAGFLITRRTGGSRDGYIDLPTGNDRDCGVSHGSGERLAAFAAAALAIMVRQSRQSGDDGSLPRALPQLRADPRRIDQR